MALTIQEIQDNITAKQDTREIINQMADYLQANPVGGGGGVQSVTATDASVLISGTATNPTVGLPYKVYTALLIQSGTSAPVPTVLENTLGDAVWSRDDVGKYRLTLSGAFPADKTWIGGFGNYAGDGNNCMPIINGGGTQYYFSMNRSDDNSIIIEIFDAAFNHAEFSTIYNGTTIYLPEIRVYP